MMLKRILLTVLCSVFALNCLADTDNKITIKKVYWSDMTIDASDSSEIIFDLDPLKPTGFASLQVEISGSGTLKITHESSNDGADYNVLDGASDIVTALTAGSEIYAFDLPFARYLKLIFAETGGGNSVTVTKATLAIQ